jgi:hypothetical protein
VPFDRINCCVLGCRRGSRKFPNGELICGRHWRSVPRAIRRRFRDLEKIARAAPDDRGAEIDASYAWDRCKIAAVEADAGI